MADTGDNVHGLGAAAPTQADMTAKHAATHPDSMMHSDGHAGAMTATGGEKQYTRPSSPTK